MEVTCEDVFTFQCQNVLHGFSSVIVGRNYTAYNQSTLRNLINKMSLPKLYGRAAVETINKFSAACTLLVLEQ